MRSRFSFSNVFYKQMRRNPIGGMPGVPQNVGVDQAHTVCACGYAWTSTENNGINHVHGGIMVVCPTCGESELVSLAKFENCQEDQKQSVNDPLAFFAMPGVIQAKEDLETKAARAIAMKFPTHQGIKLRVAGIFNHLNQTYYDPIDVPLIVEVYEKLYK